MHQQRATSQWVNTRMDLVPFAHVRWWVGEDPHTLRAYDIAPDADGLFRPAWDASTGVWQIGLEWREPRDVRQVSIRFTSPDEVSNDLRVQYWQHGWPTPAPERLPGARRGWIRRDDPWHGRWVTARGNASVVGEIFAFEFDPLDSPELGPGTEQQVVEAEHYLARFRRTIKLCILGRSAEPPRVAGLHAYSASTWREGQVDIRFGIGGQARGDWSGHAQAQNGYVLRVTPLGFAEGEDLDPKGRWRCRVRDQAKGVRLQILYADCDPASTDGTRITLHTRAHSVTFAIADLLRGPIYIKDYDLLITWAEQPIKFAALKAQIAAMPRPIYQRVPQEPEQSLQRALADIPPLDVTKQAPFGRYLPLGVEAGRQEFAVRYNGELFADKPHLKLKGRDAARLLWPGQQLRYCFGTGDPPDFREGRDVTRQSLLDGWLPVVTSRWMDREIEYEQTAFAALLDGPMTPPQARRGDEDVVVIARVMMRNATSGRKRAQVWIAITPQESLDLQGELLLARGRVVPDVSVARQWRVEPYEAPYLRFAIHVGRRGAMCTVPYAPQGQAACAVPTALLYEVELDGGEAHAITLAIPLSSFASNDDWRRVSALDYAAKLDDVIAYWRAYIGAGAQFDLPEAILSDLHRAVQVHVALSADKDPVNGLIVVPAATWRYGACGNEACWQITMLDQAGHHDRAEAYLETFLRTQGAMGLDGRFGSPKGALQGLDLDGGVVVRSGFGYNLDHGVIMECLAQHYRLSGDRAWLERVTPNLLAACEFVLRERACTQVYDAVGDRVPEWGLLPAGHLEDNPEWRHWFAVNAHAYAGLQAIAEVLHETGHPAAERLLREAAAYREDIRVAAHRAMVEAPVVRLSDGSFVPHIPTRTDLPGRELGWFREAAYGALHLAECGVLDPHEPEVTWLLEDLEDNLFVSREWGRPIDRERFWFSHGGATIQPGLADLAIDYLRRDQVEHGLRALFNALASSLYPDVRAFTEHPVIELGHGVGPFYKSSDEAKWLTWLRAFLLREEGRTLWLAPGVPRAWFAAGRSFGVQRAASFFGPLSYRVKCAASDVAIEIEAAWRATPEELCLRLRRPDRAPMRRVTINGQTHTAFDAGQELVRIAVPGERLLVRVEYANKAR